MKDKINLNKDKSKDEKLKEYILDYYKCTAELCTEAFMLICKIGHPRNEQQAQSLEEALDIYDKVRRDMDDVVSTSEKHIKAYKEKESNHGKK